MDAIRFAAVWIALVLAVMLVALFGECECFEGTCIARAHGMLTGGLCEYGLDAVTHCFGTRGREAVENAVSQCCNRPNPLFQVRPRRPCLRCARGRTQQRRGSRVCGDVAPPLTPPRQLLYVPLVTVGYAVFLSTAAPLLPGPYASEVHLCAPPRVRCEARRLTLTPHARAAGSARWRRARGSCCSF